MNEYLDIVDEKDQIIGKDTWDNVHKNYQIHRGVHVLVVNSKGEILIQKRSKHKKYMPGLFDVSVGAQVQSGETYKQAAIRESEEELGFIPKKLVKVCDYDSYNTRQREKRRLFICYDNGPFKPDAEEVESIKFISPTKIQDMLKKGVKFTDSFSLSLRCYLLNLKK